jgi:hypothetical protein
MPKPCLDIRHTRGENPFQALSGPSPECELGSVCHAQFPKDVIDIFLDCAYRQTQFVSDLLVGLGLLNQLHDLALAKRQHENGISSLKRRLLACRAGESLALGANLTTAGTSLWGQNKIGLLTFFGYHVQVASCEYHRPVG